MSNRNSFALTVRGVKNARTIPTMSTNVRYFVTMLVSGEVERFFQRTSLGFGARVIVGDWALVPSVELTNLSTFAEVSNTTNAVLPILTPLPCMTASFSISFPGSLPISCLRLAVTNAGDPLANRRIGIFRWRISCLYKNELSSMWSFPVDGMLRLRLPFGAQSTPLLHGMAGEAITGRVELCAVTASAESCRCVSVADEKSIGKASGRSSCSENSINGNLWLWHSARSLSTILEMCFLSVLCLVIRCVSFRRLSWR